MNSENVFLCICKLWIEFSTTVAQHLFSTTKLAMLHTRGGGVLWISSDGDDWMEPRVKTQKNPWTKN